jgi:hypothetical protein
MHFVNAGTAAPITYEIPRYGPHDEAQVIMTLVHAAMAATNTVEKCAILWAALVVVLVVAPKEVNNQEAIHHFFQQTPFSSYPRFPQPATDSLGYR